MCYNAILPAYRGSQTNVPETTWKQRRIKSMSGSLPKSLFWCSHGANSQTEGRTDKGLTNGGALISQSDGNRF